MKRRLDIQKAVSAVGGRIARSPLCVRCGGETLVDSPLDYDPLKPHYTGWHEPYDCYEFDHDGETWTVYLMRCQSCSGLQTHVEKRRLTNTPIRETIAP